MAIIKYGNISEVLPDLGRVRVEFPEDGIVSAPIPMIVTRTKKDEYLNAMDINEHVVCLMDDNLENGVVIGAIYNADNKPSAPANSNITRVIFEDKTEIEFDRVARMLKVTSAGTIVEISPAGTNISKGGEDLKSLMDDWIQETITHTHPSSGTPPANVALFAAIKVRILAFFP